MSKKGKVLSMIPMAFTIVILAAIFIAKTSYYFEKIQSGFFRSMAEASIWSGMSLLLSLSPMTMLAVSNLFILINKTKKNTAIIVIAIIAFLLCCILLVINIAFELVSAMGATMCLDVQWMDIMSKMLLYHFVSAIPILATFIALLRMRVR